MTQQINLFNPIFLKQKKVFTTAAMGQALGVLLVGMLALAFYGKQNSASLQRQADAGATQLVAKQAQLAKANTEFAPRQKSRELELQLAQAEAELKALREVSGVLQRGELGNTSGYSEYFKALARQNVSGLWLTGVSITGAGTDIGVQGRALAPTLVPGYIGRLTHEQVMQGKTFGSLQISQPETKKAGSDAVEAAPFVEFSLQSSMAEGGK